MVGQVIRYRKSIYWIFFSVIFSQNIYINKIDIVGLVTATDNQIFRNTGLYPSESYEDTNLNGKFDENENYIDQNYNGQFDIGTIITDDMMQLNFERFSSAINSLWRLKVFSDIQIFITNTYQNSIDIKIEVKEIPVINNIEFIGNNKIKESNLLDKIDLVALQRASMGDIFISIEKIRETYIEKNYHNVKVDYELLDTDNNYSKDILFKIEEGNKIKIKKINFIGNNSFKKSELLKLLNSTKEKKWYKFWQGSYSEDDFNLDVKNIEKFYKNNGYKNVSIISQVVEFFDNNIAITINIEENEINFYDEFKFNGNSKFSDEELINTLNIKPLSKFSQEQFDLAVSNIRNKYLDEGYFFAELDYEIIPKDNNLNINFIITENEKTKIRKISISGNDKTYDNVIRREMKIFPGDIFNYNKIYDSLNSIFLLNYFENVVPNILIVENSKNQVDLDLSVIEKETGRANFSMGYNEVQGFTGGGGFEFINFMGKGQMLAVNYSRGLQNQFQNQSSYSNSNTNYESFSVSFREPRIFDTRNSIGFSISHSEQGQGASNILKYDTVSDRGSIMFGRQFNWPDYFFKGNWTLTIRNTKYKGSLSDLSEDFDDQVIIAENSSNGYASRSGVSITQIISRDSRDRPEFTTTGSKFVWASTFSGNFLGGNENYHKQTFSFDWYSPVYKKVTMFQNFKFGALMELDDNQFIPYSARFIMGGTGIPYGEMLRGYVDNGIGPKRINAGYLSSDGGKIMLKYSMELRYKFSDSPTMYGLVFAEAGNVWSDFDSTDIFDLKRSMGIGIRVFMPMLGMLGYDVGYGFDSIYDNGDTSSRWEHHLIFGMPMN